MEVATLKFISPYPSFIIKKKKLNGKNKIHLFSFLFQNLTPINQTCPGDEAYKIFTKKKNEKGKKGTKKIKETQHKNIRSLELHHKTECNMAKLRSKRYSQGKREHLHLRETKWKQPARVDPCSHRNKAGDELHNFSQLP